MMVCGALILLAVWTTIFMVLLIPLAIGIMRTMVKEDDQKFRLLGLKMQFRLIHFDRTARFWKSSTYSPLAYTKRKPD